MWYTIKKHTKNAFEVNVYANKLDRSITADGYLSDVDLQYLQYRVVKNKSFASKFNLHDASLLVAKLNKLNLIFYEIETA